MRTGRKLVDHEPALGHEELHAEDADYPQPVQHHARDLDGVSRYLRINAGRSDRSVENVPLMAILDRAVMRERAVAAARRYDADLAIEIDKRLEHGVERDVPARHGFPR